jgi:hypothetical protein
MKCGTHGIVGKETVQECSLTPRFRFVLLAQKRVVAAAERVLLHDLRVVEALAVFWAKGADDGYCGSFLTQEVYTTWESADKQERVGLGSFVFYFVVGFPFHDSGGVYDFGVQSGCNSLKRAHADFLLQAKRVHVVSCDTGSVVLKLIFLKVIYPVLVSPYGPGHKSCENRTITVTLLCMIPSR